ncbi:hypothetical protein B296_00055266 [Ensete ventricosum]|uniref:Uncharacterized protein n=1 Tax=Ensete ventricosum TaxID=4639 RepID=A0A426WVX1_ENSVE|nr:hypothetical protein B296_00055266 [Ensete ventricosum]
MGSPLCGRCHCPSWRTGVTAPWVAAPTGVVPAGANLLVVGGCPCRQPWPQPATPIGDLAVASHPCRWHGRG